MDLSGTYRQLFFLKCMHIHCVYVHTIIYLQFILLKVDNVYYLNECFMSFTRKWITKLQIQKYNNRNTTINQQFNQHIMIFNVNTVLTSVLYTRQQCNIQISFIIYIHTTTQHQNKQQFIYKQQHDQLIIYNFQRQYLTIINNLQFVQTYILQFHALICLKFLHRKFPQTDSQKQQGRTFWKGEKYNQGNKNNYQINTEQLVSYCFGCFSDLFSLLVYLVEVTMGQKLLTIKNTQINISKRIHAWYDMYSRRKIFPS
eukprot:TRINITY_DN3339_c0_g1_i1.p1 TRINITY_DN3339_c0_g1~~TRINITY_DN3339_c0_g1_i1.p1  ORF type:complete len:257 (+),score=-24.63 TRINITY_DN3339_c0_g1_i1:260-1030(+)